MRSSRARGQIRPRLLSALAIAIAAAAAIGGSIAAQQIVPGSNVNMVSGTGFPNGDPFLQRQNEPSMSVSTRNPLHLLAGANDYRTVDLPGPFDPLRGEKMNADAWLGLFKSFDGGRTWQSTLLPGFPQDTSPAGVASPIKGRMAATDAVVKSGTNGLFYYAGLAFDRGPSAPSAIFVARFIDHNNRENGDPIEYLGTRLVDSDSGVRFLDKTALAVDIPRGAATCTIPTRLDDGTIVNQTIPSGNVYVAYSAFTGGETQSQILFSRSTDCGATWSAPANLSAGNILNQNAQIAINPANGDIWVSWRRLQAGTLQSDGIFITRSTDRGATFSRAVRVAPVQPFDQGTSTTSFRTNAFQTMTVDASGRVYVAWPERGHAVLRPDRVTGDSRIVISTSANGSTWTTPAPIDTQGLGHQLMPALTFHGGKLRLLYYDLRDDVSQLFGQFVDELPILTAPDPKPPRHTIEVYVAQAAPAAQPVFTAVRLSDYAFGVMPGTQGVQRLQYNPPNLPLFRQGTVPFMGDYIDLAPAPPIVQAANGAWQFNTAPTTAAVSHGVWTDNRDVRAPIDGDWTKYTPVMSDALGTTSLFDPTQSVPPCFVGQTGMRNQNIYTAKVTEGLFVGSPGNVKPLGSIQRGFVISVENGQAAARSYRLQILNQPPGGQASFQQFSAAGAPLLLLDVTVPGFSTVARTVYATSSAMYAQIQVSVSEIAAPGAPGVVPGGQSASIILNADPTTPSIQNPSIQNPSIQNPDIQVAEAYNPAITTAFLAPSIQNPSIQNPSIQNPSIQNPSIQNPELSNDAIANPSIIDPSIQNPSIQNPSIQNPSIQNPSIQNQDLVNGAIQDTSWVITNDGNTTASYAIKLLSNGTLPPGFKSQLVLHKTYLTPSAQDCTLALQPHTVVLANIPDPAFTQVGAVTNPSIQNPSIQNATLSLAPGESANVTLRIVDPNQFDGVEFDAGAAVAPAAVAHSVNTEDVAQGLTTPRIAIPMTITTGALASGAPGGVYSASLQTFASTGTTSWTVTQGALPPGITLNSTTGQLSGTPTAPGNYVFTVQAIDTSGNVDVQTLSIKIDPVVPSGFTRVWNGATSNWNDPKNWSPAGVPATTDSVYVSASIPVSPALVSDVTIQNIVVEAGATLDTNGFTLTVLGSADAGQTIVGSGTVVLSGIGVTALGTFPNVTVAGDVLVTGPLTATGNLTLLPGTTLNLNGFAVNVSGQLRSSAAGGLAPMIIGESGLPLLNVGGLDVNGLTLSRVSLTVGGGQLTRFDNVRFIDYQPQDVHLTLNHPGTAAPFAMSGLTFFTVPTTGRYIQANDTTADAQALVLNVSASLPGDGSSRSATQGGATINWLFNPNSASVAVTQYMSPNAAVVGGQVTYTILVTNGGPATATNVTLTNPLPAGASFVSAVPGQGSCGFSANTVSCSLGNVLNGQTVVVNITMVANAAGALNNFVTVAAAEFDPGTFDNSQTVSTPVFATTATADLSITKSDSADPVVTGAPFSYSLTVANAGPAAASPVIVVDSLPAGVTASGATSTSGICTVSATTVTCHIASLAVGQQATVTITAAASGFGIVTNTASVFSPQPDPNPANNSATETTVVGATAGCTSPSFLFAGDVTPFTGPVTAVRLADMNKDGALDIVATHQSSPGVVSVVLLAADSSVIATNTTSISGAAFELAVGDFTGDGNPDAIVGAGGTPNTLRLLVGDGAGHLTETGTPIPVANAFLVVAFDQDGDGDLDLLAKGTANDLVLLKNNGFGGMASPVSLIADASTTAVTGDFNGDTRPDIAVAHSAQGISILLADGAGGYLAPVPYATATSPRVRPAGDLNGDGDIDLLIATGTGGNGTSATKVRLGDGSGAFGPELDAATGNTANVVTAADINGDGKPDLVAGHGSTNAIGIQLGNGTGGFSAPVFLAASVFSNPAVGDINGDSKPDIVIGDGAGTLRGFTNTCGTSPVDLSVALVESADPVNEGDEIVYTLTLRNLANQAATDVRVNTVFSLPLTGTTLPPMTVSSTSTLSGTLDVAGATYTWVFPSLAAQATGTIEFRVRLNAGGSLRVSAGATSANAETNAANNTALETTTVNAIGRDLVVTNTNDSGTGSLRQAILDSNSDAGDVDRIVFQVPGTGTHTIVPLSVLPPITQPTTIDGTTQPGFSGMPLIELDGNGLNATGLLITGGGSTVRGLVINRFAGGPGIRIQTAGSNVIAGNFIGTDPTGTIARANGGGGIVIVTAGNTVGGTAAGDRNLVSGNSGTGILLSTTSATNNLVAGNFVGTDVTGTAAIPNTNAGIQVIAGSNNVIGGTTPAHRNLVSGGGINGVSLRGGATGNRVEGNYIGTNVTGTAALANGAAGVIIGESSNNVIGGIAPGAGNLLSGNLHAGVLFVVQGAPNTATGNLVQGNLIGTNAAGTGAIPNGFAGLNITDTASANTIGGTTTAARNVISGNGRGIAISVAAASNVVQGNYIGVDVTGTAILGNVAEGISISAVANTVIGGTAAGAGNVISGNGGTGVGVFGGASQTSITGNRIGTNAAGTAAIPNGIDGVGIADSTGTAVGGTTAAARNLISGNTRNGVGIFNAGATGNVVAGNYIGVNGAGTAALGNGSFGVGIGNGASGNTIGGTAAGSTNVISANVGAVGFFSGAASNTLAGNLIGTTASGTSPAGNGSSSIYVDGPNNTIGGSAAGAGNVIAATTQFSGIHLDPNGSGTIIQGNFIGTDRTATLNLGGVGDGIYIKSSNNVIGGTLAGEANTIRFNAFKGVVVDTGTGNRISGNAIFDNGQTGIDLVPFGLTANDAGDGDAGANNLQNFPQLTSAVTAGGTTAVQGTLNSTANTAFRLEFFSNAACDGSGNGEGQTFAGFTSVTTDASGNATFSASISAASIVTATATDPNGNTSEFSPCRTATAGATTFAVINTLDSGPGTLRAAIINANASIGTLDTITFNIAGTGVRRISPLSPLPAITDAVIIDGTTQPGYAGTPLIEVDGASAGGAANGVEITAGNSTVRGLAINRFGTGGTGNGGAGIALLGGGGNTIEGNYLGVDPAGTLARPNRTDGVFIDGPSNVIGGTAAATRNVISGNGRIGVVVSGANATGNQIRGNFIGTTAAGTGALPNANSGVVIFNAPGNTIGGTAAGTANVVSGNTDAGIGLFGTGSTGNTVAGNLIGVDVNGSAALPNSIGVNLGGGAANNVIGGTSAAARNILSGNSGDGVLIQDQSAPYAVNNRIEGNYIGLNAAGTAAVPNGLNGVEIIAAATTTATANVVGGTAAGAGNVISGNGINGVILNGPGTLVQGNLIGTNPAGTAAIANGVGVQIRGTVNVTATFNVIGGTVAAARNVISGNSEGVLILNDGAATVPSGNVVQRNYIGLNAAGTAAIPNNSAGVSIFSLVGAVPTGNTIGGSSPNGNVISGNTGAGVSIQANGNTVIGNTIGLRPDLGAKVPNGGGGVDINGSTNTVGGSVAGAGNIITGNTGNGVRVVSGSGNLILGNVIGGNPTSILATLTGNTVNGILVSGTNTVIGGQLNAERNIVHNNGASGIRVNAGTGHSILYNSVHANAGLGIDLAPVGLSPNDAGDTDGGVNLLQNFPVLALAVQNGSSVSVSGTINSTASTALRLQFFSIDDLVGGTYCDASGNGEGQTYLGETTVTTDAGGNASFTVPLPLGAGSVVTATATDPAGNTSEFSQCRAVVTPMTFTVTTVNDSGVGSLRQAILDANANVGVTDTIAFNIAGAGVRTIAPLSFLPIITDPVVIDGTSQPGFAGTPLIELDGSGAGGGSNGLHITAGNSTVRGLAINRFGTGGTGNGGAGIALVTAGGNVVEGNYIGVDAAGAVARANRTDGVWTDSSGNRIGGTTAAQRNVISGNARYGVVITGAATSTNVIAGNYIGTNAAGSTAVANALGGVIVDGPTNTIGGLSSAAGNVISGNGGPGITINGANAAANVVARNFIGLNSGGTAAIPNDRGVLVTGTVLANTIGGESSGPNAGTNVISGNTNAGVELAGSSAFVQGNTIGLRADLTAKVPNTGSGVLISGVNNNVGDADSGPGHANTITGNGGEGIRVNATASDTLINNNLIGPNPTSGNPALTGNGSHGIFVAGTDVRIEGNQIQVNGGDGVRIAGGTSNSILFNSIRGNAALGIDLAPAGVSANDAADADTGANNLQNYPVLTSATSITGSTTVAGTLNTVAATAYRVQFFVDTACDVSGNGEGQTYLGETSFGTDASGNASFSLTVPTTTPIGRVITATATDPSGNTSEFSTCITVVDGSNQAPVANAGNNQSVPVGTTVQLSGAGSSDPDNNTLTYAWTLVSKPSGSLAALTNATAVNPTFVPDLVGDYTARLVVNDGTVNSAADDVLVTATSNAITMALVGTPLVGVGRQAILGVNLPTPAPAGGTVVTVTSDDTAILTVAAPATVNIAAGATSGQVTLNGVTTGTTIVRATAPGYQNGSLTLTVTQNVLTVPATLNVPFSQNASLPVNIPQPAPAGGVVVALASSAPGTIEVLTPTVTIAQGALSANGTVRGLGIGSATVTATNAGFSSASSLVSSTGNLNIVQTSTSLTAAFTRSITIQLESGGSPIAAPAGGVTVALTPVDPACVSVPASVSIGQGLVSTSVTLSYGGTAARPCTTTVNATAASLTGDSVSVTVNADPSIQLFSLRRIGGGLQAGPFVLQLGESNHGGTTVTLTTSDPNIMRLSPNAATVANANGSIQLTIPDGQIQATYYIQAMSPTALGDITVTASATGFQNGTAVVPIVQPAVMLTGVPVTTTTLSADTLFFVGVGVTGQFTTSIGEFQTVRPGGDLSFTVANSNSAVGQLRTLAGVGQSRSVTITGGNSFSGGTLAAGGVAFDPLAGSGSTIVSVSATGFTTTPEASATTTVSAPGIQLFSLPYRVGGGLQSGPFLARLGGANHGGVTLTLTSSDPNLMRLSASASTAGAANGTLTFSIADGQTDATYYIQAMSPTVIGDGTVTATATNFANGTGTVHIVQPSMMLTGLSPTTTSLSADTVFNIGVGVTSTFGTSIGEFQSVRAGGALSFTVTNSNAAAAQLRTSAGVGQSRTVTIAGGTSFSSGAVASGGIAFDPLNSGSTTVAVSGTGFNATPEASVAVTVSAPGIQLFSLPARVGGGLQSGPFLVRLGGANHGGVTLTLTSSDTARMRLAPNATTAGANAPLQLTIPDGQTDATYYIQAMSATLLGSVTITAAATGFNNGTGTVNVVQPTVIINSLPTTTTSLSADSLFYVGVGVVGQFSPSISEYQPVRAGSSLAVTVTNSNAAVGQLRTSAGTAQSQTVTIAGGNSFSSSVLASGGIAFDPIGGGSTTVAASAAGFATNTESSVAVTVNAPGITLFSLPRRIGGGLQSGPFLLRLGGANHGGVQVTLTSSNPAIMRLAPDASTAGAVNGVLQLSIADGQTDATYYIQGVSPSSLGTVTITASALGFSDQTGTVDIVQPSIIVSGLSTTANAGAAEMPFSVGVGAVFQNTTSIGEFQAVRAGTTLSVTVTNSNAAAAQLRTTAGTAQSRTITISGGNTFSPGTVNTGGIAFVPIAAGSTSVSASATGFAPATENPVTVTVSGALVGSSTTTKGAPKKKGG